MLNGLKPYNYLTYVMEQMKALGPFPEKEAMLKLLPWSTSLPADCHSKLKKKKSVFDGDGMPFFIHPADKQNFISGEGMYDIPWESCRSPF